MKKEICGCIDLGSSFFRLLVADAGVGGGALGIRVLAEGRRYVGLGDDLVSSGAVSARRLADAERAVEDLVGAARDAGCASPVLVGTNTFREAANGIMAAARLGARAGLPVTILSQRGEAALGFLGATAALQRGRVIILVDPGGTSTEIAWGEAGRFKGFRGVAWGTHRVDALLAPCRWSPLRLRRVRSGSALGEIARAAREAAREAHSTLPECGESPTIIATGGTAVSLAVWKRSLGGDAPALHEMEEIGTGDLFLMQRRLGGRFRARLEHRLPLESARIRLLPAGLAIIGALAEALGARRIFITARDLRWGVIERRGRFEAMETIGGRESDALERPLSLSPRGAAASAKGVSGA